VIYSLSSNNKSITLAHHDCYSATCTAIGSAIIIPIMRQSSTITDYFVQQVTTI
jgi:hypothetical protein